MSEFIIESSCCIVCLLCFFCKKSRAKTTNIFCRCSDTLLEKVPETLPESEAVMKKNQYKRAFTITWLQKNAHQFYKLNDGWHIDQGRLLSVPLCTTHHTEFQTDWSERVNALNDKDVYVEPSEDTINVAKFFMNWGGVFRFSNSSSDLAKVKPLPYYPLDVTVPVSKSNPTFNDIWGYHTLTVTGYQNGTIVFYNKEEGMWYQLDESFPISVNSKEKKDIKVFMVGMLPQGVNVNELITNFRNDSKQLKKK